MQGITVNMTLGTTLSGTLQADDRVLKIGKEEGGFQPYELLLGALGSCYYANFIGIAQKMRLEYDGVDIHLHGVKRDEIPSTLKTAEMVVTVRGAKSEKGFDRVSSLSAKYCSDHETLSKVAEISIDLRFAEA